MELTVERQLDLFGPPAFGNAPVTRAAAGVAIRPTDWQDDDLAAGLLPAMKGATPETLPTLDDDQAGDPTTHFLRNGLPIS